MQLYNQFGGEDNKQNLIPKPVKPLSDEELAQRAIDEKAKAHEIIHKTEKQKRIAEQHRAEFESRVASGQVKPFRMHQQAKPPISKSWLGRKRRAALEAEQNL
ncbi:TPA: hypothetical protein ACQZHW_003130 [Enterobacter hormaechei]